MNLINKRIYQVNSFLILNLDKHFLKNHINPLSSLGEGISVFTSPYLSAGAPALDEAKGLIKLIIL